MKKLALAIACVALLSTGAWADAPQITLSKSLNSIGQAVFANNSGTLNFWFNGSASTCGATRAGCVSGTAFLDPNGDLGTYWMWIVGSHPTLAATSDPDFFTVNPGSYTVNLELDLKNGQKFTATLALDSLSADVAGYPTFDGTFKTTSSTSEFYADGFSANEPPGHIDFTLSVPSNTTLSKLGNHQSVKGRVSSGEIDSPVPEPSSLALMGTGVLGLAGLIRRKLNS